MVLEFHNLLVQESMIQHVDDFPVHNLLELFQVNHKPRPLIDLTFDRYFQRVVVAVAVRVVALPKKTFVLFRGELRIVVEVRSRKLRFPRQIDHRSQLLTSGLLGIDESTVPWGSECAAEYDADCAYMRPFHVTACRTLTCHQERRSSHVKSGNPKNAARLARPGKCA